MNSKRITDAEVATLDELCISCPKGCYTRNCPFQKLAGLTRSTRRSLFCEMHPEQYRHLFALATDCSCPRDPGAMTQTTA
jgi:hypothetical protein